MRALRNVVDRTLGRVSMYRLVLLILVALAVVYTIFTATGVIEGLSTTDNLIALAVLVVSSYVANRLFGLIWRMTPHADSALITALLLYFLFVPLTIDTSNLAWLAGAAVLANASKYLLAWRGRHIFNPAAAGALLIVLAQQAVGREFSINPIWQTAATESLLPFVALGALLVVLRTRRLDIAAIYIAIAAGLVVWGLVGFGQPVTEAISTTLTSYPVLFVAGFMLTEPLTLSSRRTHRWIVAGVTALVFAYPIAITRITTTAPDLGVLTPTPEIALLVGNLVAFALSRRSGVRLTLREKRPLGGDVWEFGFTSRHPVRHAAGQYLELHLPHRRGDRRGVRRAFSITSAPGSDVVRIAIRVPQPGSSFKRALMDLSPGDQVQSTGVHGDFVLPPSKPVLLVAGGIGVTPFLSQLRAHPEADAVLIYGVPDGDAVPYAEELLEMAVPVHLVSPNIPRDLPPGWTHHQRATISADIIDQAVPDARERVALVSGPALMVNAVRGLLSRRSRSVRTDYFTGY